MSDLWCLSYACLSLVHCFAQETGKWASSSSTNKFFIIWSWPLPRGVLTAQIGEPLIHKQLLRDQWPMKQFCTYGSDAEFCGNGKSDSFPPSFFARERARDRTQWSALVKSRFQGVLDTECTRLLRDQVPMKQFIQMLHSFTLWGTMWTFLTTQT